MLNFLYHIADAQVFFLMVAATVVFSLFLIIVNKFFIFYKLRYKDNATTASVASLIGIIYGVLAGFICLYLLNNQDHASTAVLSEGTATANIYRESRWLREPMQHQIQTDLRTYLENAINVEWPAMREGKHIADTNDHIIDTLSDRLIKYPIRTPADSIVIADLLQEIKALFKGRQERIEISKIELSPEIWEVILISTVLIIMINYAFRVNFYLHLFSITAFSIMAASILFLLVTLDRPFQGEFIVGPDVLRSVLNYMKQDTFQHRDSR